MTNEQWHKIVDYSRASYLAGGGTNRKFRRLWPVSYMDWLMLSQLGVKRDGTQLPQGVPPRAEILPAIEAYMTRFVVDFQPRTARSLRPRRDKIARFGAPEMLETAEVFERSPRIVPDDGVRIVCIASELWPALEGCTAFYLPSDGDSRAHRWSPIIGVRDQQVQAFVMPVLVNPEHIYAR